MYCVGLEFGIVIVVNDSQSSKHHSPITFNSSFSSISFKFIHPFTISFEIDSTELPIVILTFPNKLAYLIA